MSYELLNVFFRQTTLTDGENQYFSNRTRSTLVNAKTTPPNGLHFETGEKEIKNPYIYAAPPLNRVRQFQISYRSVKDSGHNREIDRKFRMLKSKQRPASSLGQ